MNKITSPERRERKTLKFHKSAIKKACAALVKDGYDRNQAIGALIEFFLTGKHNSVMFNTVLRSYMMLLNNMNMERKRILFKPCFTSAKSRKMLSEIREGRK